MEGVLKKGFTYIEVLFAITLTAVIFSAVLPLLENTITKNQDTRLKLVAYEAASNQVEELRDTKVLSLVDQTHIPFTIPEIPGSTGDVYITKPLGDPKIAVVDVKVNWRFHNKNQVAEIKTYLYGSTE